MFASQETILDLPFPVARARLVSLARRGGLDGAAGRAYADGYTAVIRAGPFGQARGASKLVRVRFVEPVEHDNLAVLPFRWEATGAAGGMFPVLDADITPSARRRPDQAGAGRVLPGAAGRLRGRA
jgi:hypothetical protein